MNDDMTHKIDRDIVGDLIGVYNSPGSLGIKRSWIPFPVWDAVMSSRFIRWPVVGRFLLWAMNLQTKYRPGPSVPLDLVLREQITKRDAEGKNP